MVDLDAISTCSELTSEVAARAASSSASLKTLLGRIAEVAQPEQGWTRLLKLIPKLAAAEWVEGDLQVDFSGDDKETTISCYAVLGIGIRERLCPPYTLAVPIDEFQRAVVLTPAVVAPLRAHQGLNRLTLALGARVRSKDIPDFEVEEKAKGDGERITAKPPPMPDDTDSKPTSPPDAES